MANVVNKLSQAWYQKPGLLTLLLLPLAILYASITAVRRLCYRAGLCRSYHLPVPVIVVGNITVGGTGKTPLTIALVKLLQQQGYQPGVISRGYGGSHLTPTVVTAKSQSLVVGDEPLLIQRQTTAPVVVAADRVAAGRLLLEQFPCDVIITDDGLQHYRLQRDIEIAVLDGQRRLGNAWHLPAGPLREGKGRLKQVDFIVSNGQALPGEFPMQLKPADFVNLKTQQLRPISDFIGLAVNAVAGIGNPQRFFELLEKMGLQVKAHIFADHHKFEAEDISFNNTFPILMTEKDAVKCISFATEDCWYLPISAHLSDDFSTKLLTLLSQIKNNGNFNHKQR